MRLERAAYIEQESEYGNDRAPTLEAQTEPSHRPSAHALLGVGALAKPTGQEPDLVLHGAVVHAVTSLVLPVAVRGEGTSMAQHVAKIAATRQAV